MSLIKEKNQISSRGVPSKEGLWLDSIKSRQKEWQYSKARLSYEEILNIAFPKEYQKVYYWMALSFMELLCKKIHLTSKEVADWRESSEFSKSTFYNKILPRLKQIGLIDTTRQEIDLRDTKKKYRKMTYNLSDRFGIFFKTIGEQVIQLNNTAKMKVKTFNQEQDYEDYLD